MNHISTTSILGVRVSAITYADALREIGQWIIEKKRRYVCVAATHLVMECQKDERLCRGVNRAGLVTPDGMPLVWLLRLYSHKKIERVYGPTLMLKTCRLAEKNGYKIFLLGGSFGQSRQLRQKLKKKFPALRIVGSRDTPVRPIPEKDNQAIVKEMNQSNAQVAFIGTGCPTQELWMLENRKRLAAPVLIGVGAAFDFLSGRVSQAPAWMQNTGLEWLFRLTQEPRRFWRRYTLLNAQFVWKITGQLFRDFLSH